MIFLRVTTLTNSFGQCDYKGLDIDKFVPGSQVYKKDMTMCVIATTEDGELPSNPDLEIITEQQYIQEKQEIIAEYQIEQQTIDQKIALMQAAIDDLILNGGAL